MVKITTLIENKIGSNSELIKENGLSFYIEFNNKKILFDTGENGVVVDNAKILNIELNELDYIILSHGHHDHTGGFKRIMETTNKEFKLIADEKLLNLKHARMENGNIRKLEDDINLEILNKNNIEYMLFNSGSYTVEKNIYTISNFKYKTAYEKKYVDFLLKENTSYIVDSFFDELSLVIDIPKGLVVFVGCSHPGIVNMLMGIKEKLNRNIYAVFGGTHLYAASKSHLESIVDYINSERIEIVGLCHCTGTKSEEYLKSRLPNQYVPVRLGSLIHV